MTMVYDRRTHRKTFIYMINHKPDLLNDGKWFVFLLFFVFSLPVYAWNQMGHRVISQIAYQQLKPDVRGKVDKLSRIFDAQEGSRTPFSKGSVWPDTLKRYDVREFDDMHFIDSPYVTDGSTSIPAATDNVVSAIDQFLARANDPSLDIFEQAIALRFLSHFIGDIHQPMHCVNLFSAEFPEGDKGGNLYRVESDRYQNLHQLWDAGVGLFDEGASHQTLAVEKMARRLQKKFPIQSFAPELFTLSPTEWANESYELAVKTAYQAAYGITITTEYAKLGQTIVEQRVSLAGYRLATVLNRLFQ